MKSNGVEKLLKSIEKLKQNMVKEQVDARIKELKDIGKKPFNEIFKELCFCILTANFNAEKSMKIQMEIGDGFLLLSKSKLAEKLKSLGYRFPNSRAKYIVEARKHMGPLKDAINSFKDENELRDWLIKSFRGIGYKEASHFLRNIGYTNLAIIDFHIINLLAKYGLIEKSKTMTKRRYLEIEELLREIARKTSLNLAELDLYLWYMETGKILK
ncbi:MAG: N-glycosylase/DNA lyase [Candidatus Bathyarchaeia archaeon]